MSEGSWQQWFESIITTATTTTSTSSTASTTTSTNNVLEKSEISKSKSSASAAAATTQKGKNTALDLQDLNTLAKLHCWKAMEECASSVESIHHTTLTPAGNAPLHSAISNGAPLSTIQALIVASPMSVQKANNFGNTPLHFAAWKNKYRDSFAIVEFLLQYHPQSARAVNRHGNLPLHHATNYKAHADIVQILYRAYPQAISMKNDKGMTPLDHAVHRFGDQHPVVALLRGETARNYVYEQFASKLILQHNNNDNNNNNNGGRITTSFNNGTVRNRTRAQDSIQYAQSTSTNTTSTTTAPVITADVWDEIQL